MIVENDDVKWEDNLLIGLLTLLVGLVVVASTPAGAEGAKRLNIAIVWRTMFHLPDWLAAETGTRASSGNTLQMMMGRNSEANAALVVNGPLESRPAR